MNLEDLKRTVARTEAKPAGGEPRIGTAFLVLSRRLLTCAHCLGTRDASATTVELTFSRWEPGQRRQTAEVVEVDWAADIALLRLTEDGVVDPMPRADRSANEAGWQSFGHPSQVGEDGIVFRGQVADARSRLFDSDLMQLQCVEAADHVRGASGSPVMVDGHIVGMLTNQLLEYSYGRPEAVKPAFHAIYALPVETIGALPAFRAPLEWRGPTPAQTMVLQAARAAHVETERRIVADGKYTAARFVPREDVGAAFKSFMAQQERKCFLVVAKAGAGKTTALSHLAWNSTQAPALFFRGSVDDYSLEAVKAMAQAVLLDPAAEPNRAPRTWDELMQVLQKAGSSLLLFIDAINETKFSEIADRRKELQLLLEFVESQPIRVVVSCRDVFWTGHFIDPRSPQEDFWWRHVYDPTYADRRALALEHARRAREEAEQAQSTAGRAHKLTEKEIADREEQVIKTVEHRPSILLGDFTAPELEMALDLYRVSVESQDLQARLRHPLLLHLYSESATGGAGGVDAPTLGELLGRYVDFKLASVRKAVASYDAAAGHRLLDRLAAEMRRLGHGKVGHDVLDALVGDKAELQAIRTYLLDEGVILESTADGLVGFQFDALFEYVLGRQLTAALGTAAQDAVEAQVQALVAEAQKFESLVGAIQYSCVELETREPALYRQFLAMLAASSPFGKDVFLRVIGDVEEPLHDELLPSLLSVLGDATASQSVATEAVARIADKTPGAGLTLARAVVKRGGDLAAVRCAGVLDDPRLPLRDRAAIAAVLLASRSVDAAEAVVATLCAALPIAWAGFRRQVSGALDPEDLEPLVAAVRDKSVSFAGLIALVSDFVPMVVHRFSAGEAGTILGALLRRSEYNPIFHALTVSKLVGRMIAVDSDDIATLVEIGQEKPQLLATLNALILQELTDEEHKKKALWVLVTLARGGLARKDQNNLAWIALSEAVFLQRDIVERVAACLTPAEASQMTARLDALGINTLRGLSKWRIGTMIAVDTALLSILACFGVLPLFFGPDIYRVQGAPGIESLLAIVCHIVVVSLAEPTISSGALVLSRMRQAIGVAAAAGALAVAWWLRWLPVLAIASGVALGVWMAVFLARKGWTPRQVVTAFVTRVAMYAVTGVVLAPLIWALASRWGLAPALILATVAWRSLRLLMMLEFLSGSFMAAAARAGVPLLLALLGTRWWTGSLGNLLSAAILANVLASAVVVGVLDFKQGVLRGSPGKGVRSAVAVVGAAGTTLFAWLGWWGWAGVVSGMAIALLLPISGTARWVERRVAGVSEAVVFGFLAGLVIWWRWDPAEGLVALYAESALWLAVLSTTTLLVGLGVFSSYLARKQLRISLRETEGLTRGRGDAPGQ